MTFETFPSEMPEHLLQEGGDDAASPTRGSRRRRFAGQPRMDGFDGVKSYEHWCSYLEMAARRRFLSSSSRNCHMMGFDSGGANEIEIGNDDDDEEWTGTADDIGAGKRRRRKKRMSNGSNVNGKGNVKVNVNDDNGNESKVDSGSSNNGNNNEEVVANAEIKDGGEIDGKNSKAADQSAGNGSGSAKVKGKRKRQKVTPPAPPPTEIIELMDSSDENDEDEELANVKVVATSKPALPSSAPSEPNPLKAKNMAAPVFLPDPPVKIAAKTLVSIPFSTVPSRVPIFGMCVMSYVNRHPPQPDILSKGATTLETLRYNIVSTPTVDPYRTYLIDLGWGTAYVPLVKSTSVNASPSCLELPSICTITKPAKATSMSFRSNKSRRSSLSLHPADYARMRMSHCYLNDTLINFYTALLNGEIEAKLEKRRAGAGAGVGLQSKVHIFPTYFYTRLQDLTNGSKKVRRGNDIMRATLCTKREAGQSSSFLKPNPAPL